MKALILDDDELLCRLISKVLSREGHETVIALDGEEAIEIIHNGNFDLLITDIFMPKKEGLEVIQEIRAINPLIKIIAVSSDGLAGFSSFLEVAKAFGANASLKKPFSPTQLIEIVSGLDAPAHAPLHAV